MSCGYVAAMPWNRFAVATSSPLWMRWTNVIESAAGFDVRAGLWQTLHMPTFTRPPPWNVADVVVSALNLPWQLSQPLCAAISREPGVLESGCDKALGTLEVAFDPSKLDETALAGRVRLLGLEILGAVEHATYRVTGLD